MAKFKISLREKPTGRRMGCLKDDRGKLALFNTFESAVEAAKVITKNDESVETHIHKIKG